MSVWLLVAAVVIFDTVFMLTGLRVVGEAERVVVFRLGRFHRVMGPGLVFVLPMVDRAERVDLDARVPEWRGLDGDGIERRVGELAQQGRVHPA